MIKITTAEKQKYLVQNMIFVGTIYDTFEALEETMEKLKLARPLDLIREAKTAFAYEVIECAERDSAFRTEIRPIRSVQSPRPNETVIRH